MPSLATHGKACRKNSPDGALKGKICPFCFGTGWEEVDGDDGYTYMRECGCGLRRRSVVDGLLSFADLPRSFRHMGLDGFRPSLYQSAEARKMAVSACNAVKYWLEHLEEILERGTGLYLYSLVSGSGKTRMAAGIAHELIYKHDFKVKFMTVGQLRQAVKDSWSSQNAHRFEERAGSESRLLNALISADVLVLDDFGSEGEKNWMDEKISHIVNSRYLDRRVTIFTSRFDIDSLDCAEQIKGRLKEMTFVVHFPEESVRSYIAAQNRNQLLTGAAPK